MKALRFTLFLGLIAFFIPTTTSNAATAVSSEEANVAIAKKMLDSKSTFTLSGKMQRSAEKLAGKFQKRIQKFERLFGKSSGDAGIDFKDPVQKWLWFALLGWLAGALIYSFGYFVAAPFWYLGYLCWLAGTACFVVWILKKTGNL